MASAHPDPAAWLDAVADGVVIADGAGRVVAINEVAASLLQVTDGLGRPLREVLDLHDPSGCCTWWTQVDPYGRWQPGSALAESLWMLPDGREVLATTRFRRTPGEGITSVGVVLRRARGRARIERDRSDLIATVAHELRNPLTGIQNFISVLSERSNELSAEEQALLLRSIDHDTARLGRLISELLTVSGIDAGQVRLHRDWVDLAAILAALVPALSTPQRPIAVQTEPVPDLFLDPDKTRQVVGNLVENAIIHGSGPIEVSLSSVDDEGWVRLLVDDAGEGIPDDVRDRVFAKFYAGAASAGSGLGLYIVKGLVEAEGGHIIVSRSPSGGARFDVRWPVVEIAP